MSLDDDDTGRTLDEREEARQRAAVAALRALDDVTAPGALRRDVTEAVARATAPHARRRRAWRLPRAGALAGASALLAVLVVAIVLTGGGDGGGGGATPSVTDVARVALRPAAAPAPVARPGGELLTASAGPIAFPTWTRAGWHAVGERTDTIGGHELRTVFYADGSGRRIGYAIADAALPVVGGRLVERHGARLRVLASGGTRVVTWRRDGRTCILAGRDVATGRLLTLAAYAA